MRIFKIFKPKYFVSIVILIIVGLISTYSSAASLKVGLYPWVPRQNQFKEVVTAAWKAQEPNIALEFVYWDGYQQDPPEDLDVFVFDAIFLTYFQASNFLSPIRDNEVRNLKDFVPYAIEGARIKGQLYGIPQLGCTNVLFYRKGDKALAKAKTIQDIFQTIGQCPFHGVIPPENVGMMVDLSGKTTDACLYLETVQDLNGIYTPYPLLPPAAEADKHSIKNLQLILKMANKEHANWPPPEEEPYKRAALFGEGKGRALIGFTEFMSAMGANVDKVAFKLISFGDKDNVPLFYTDIIGINATTVARGNRLHALKLANLLASTKVMVAISKPTKDNEFPQYLMPVRKSVFKELGKKYPIYRAMHVLLIKEKIRPRMFTMGPDARGWLKANKRAIHEAIFNTEVCPDDK
jgi:thiamine pyridinylase